MIKEFSSEAMKRLMSQLIVCTKEAAEDRDLTVTHSGMYEKANVCHQLLLDQAQTFIFEPHDSYVEMKKSQAVAKPKKYEFYQSAEDLENVLRIAKKSHFMIFNHHSTAGLKSVADLTNRAYLYIPLERFCKHIVSYQSLLGMKHFEIMLYFKFLDDYPSAFNLEQSYVVSLYKKNRISVFTIQEVQAALNGLLDLDNLDQPMDLSITQRLS